MESDLRKMFECPICTDILTPPILMCKNGHSFCNSCIQELATCSVCGETINGYNNIVEKMLQEIHLPCRNASKGCSFYNLVAQVKDHENHCNYSLVECPRKGCTWIGTVQAVEEHCRSLHIEQMGNTKNLKCLPMKTIFNPNLVYGFLLRASDQTFVFRYGLVKPTNCIKYCAATINLNSAKEFDFVVRFINKTNETVYYEFNCPCRPLNVGWRNSFEELPATVLISYNLVKDFFDEATKSFVCVINVIERSS